jgi:3-oxoacyl-[acyl-carrier protein] reductase
MIDLTNNVILITGGSRGIGLATSLLATKAGAKVAISYAGNKAAAEAAKAEVEKLGGEALLLPGDLTDEKIAEAAVAKTVEHFGRLDTLVNNHGIWNYGAIDSMSSETWLRLMDVNLNSVFYITRAATKVMKEQGSGTVIMVTSTAAQRGEAEHGHYAASKGALVALTKSISSELAPLGITCNSVAPGWVDTEMSVDSLSDPANREKIRKSIPVQRIPPAEDIAGPIIFLASKLARHISGEILNVNGGAVLNG